MFYYLNQSMDQQNMVHQLWKAKLARKSLKDSLMERPLTNFSPIETTSIYFPQANLDTLSSDHLYLIKILKILHNGLQQSNPLDVEHIQRSKQGKLHHARWLTKANRTLRLCMSTENPSAGLTEIISYIATVYGPLALRGFL